MNRISRFLVSLDYQQRDITYILEKRWSHGLNGTVRLG